jgi:hypothetical protein
MSLRSLLARLARFISRLVSGSDVIHVLARKTAVPYPIIQTAPVVSGTPTTGSTLTTTNGTWAGSPVSYAYQWLRDGVAIGSATASTYVLVVADEGHQVSCQVAATNAAPVTGYAVSNRLSIALTPPTNTVAPVISGTATQYQTLTLTSNGTWTRSPTSYAYAWRRDGVAIPGATGTTYVLDTADVGKTITCAVTASNSGGASSAVASNGIGPIAAFGGLTAPTLEVWNGTAPSTNHANYGSSATGVSDPALLWITIPIDSGEGDYLDLELDIVGAATLGGGGYNPANTNYKYERAILISQATAQGSGTISGTTLTYTAGTGTLAIGNLITGPGIAANTKIVSGSGTTWTVSISQTVSSSVTINAYDLILANPTTFVPLTRYGILNGLSGALNWKGHVIVVRDLGDTTIKSAYSNDVSWTYGGALFIPSTTQPTVQNANSNTRTFSGSDFKAGGQPAIWLEYGSSTVTVTGLKLVGAGPSGADIVFGSSKQFQQSATGPTAVGLWVAPDGASGLVAADGNYDIVVTLSATFNGKVSAMCGSFKGLLSGTPVETAVKVPAATSSPEVTSSSLTNAAGDLSLAFWETGGSTPHTVTSGNGATIVADGMFLAGSTSMNYGHIAQMLTVGAWTPSFTQGGSNTNTILAARWQKA